MTIAAAAGMALGLALLLTGVPPLRRVRLAHRVDPYLHGLRGRPSLLGARPARSSSSLVDRVAELTSRFLPQADVELRRRLDAAGWSSDAASFRFEQVSWALVSLGFVLVVVVFLLRAGVAIDPSTLPPAAVLALGGGYLARDWWLSKQGEARKARMREQLPTALDLITLSLMAGESVPAAFTRVGRALRHGIGRELDAVFADVRAGSNVVDALEGLRFRLRDRSIDRFVDALITGIERGTPLADVLRAQSDDERDARRRELLESGGRREVLMLIPVVFLIMPVVVLFALFPGLVALELFVP